MQNGAASSDLRALTRSAVRQEIARVAMELFLTRGFDATTMDQVGEVVGISRRSLFRYFATKEDIVLGDMSALGGQIRAELEARPDDETPWEAMRAALRVLGDAYPPEIGIRVSRMMLDTPSLRARRTEKQLRWVADLVPAIQRRLGLPPGADPDPGAQAIVTCALACLDIATETWARRGGDDDIEQLFDQAAHAVRG